MGLSLKRLFDALKSFFSRYRLKEEFPSRACINQVNAIIYCLPSEERDLLPTALVALFAERADVPPNKAVDMSKPLAEQSFCEETIMFLHYFNCLFLEVSNSNVSTAEELKEAQIRATKMFTNILQSNENARTS